MPCHLQWVWKKAKIKTNKTNTGINTKTKKSLRRAAELRKKGPAAVTAEGPWIKLFEKIL
ncbi:hypothetical protein GCM10008915_78460 [Bifidobacterium pullorum subsp. gallinarum]